MRRAAENYLTLYFFSFLLPKTICKSRFLWGNSGGNTLFPIRFTIGFLTKFYPLFFPRFFRRKFPTFPQFFSFVLHAFLCPSIFLLWLVEYLLNILLSLLSEKTIVAENSNDRP